MYKVSKFALTLIIAAAAPAALAVPAKPGLLTVTQADGTSLQVRLMGDERSHFYLTEDGYLLQNDKDTYYYADVDDSGAIVRSNIRAVDARLRDGVARQYLSKVDMTRAYEKMNARAECETATFSSAPRRGPGLFPGTHFPSMGKQKGLVVLVEYTDTKFNTAYDPADYFARMLNEPGFSDYSATGSAVDFFRESSMGQFEPEFDVYGPITLSRNMAYYGGNDWYGNDSNPQKMVIEACQQLDATVDFSQYDRDGDGYIDNVFVFYAGRGEASGGSADTVWPHSWDVSAAESVTYTFDGVILDHYACSNEWEGSRPDGVGTFVHEFSHVMGLPDLYATSYTSAFTPGAWSAMDYGPYNNNGCTPPLYSAYERYSLGWIEPLPIGGPINATLYPIGTNQAGIIATGDPEEYFLVENRQQTGWDTYIPGHGMLVWHVDYDSYVWSRNVVNNTASHQYVDIEEADGIQSESTRAGDAFPGTSGKTSFTATTSPAMKTWAGTGLDFPITDIAESADGIITFKVCGGHEPLAPTTALEPGNIAAESFVARWEDAGEDASYVLSVYSYADGGGSAAPAAAGDRKIYVEGYRALRLSGVTSCEVTGLEAETDYYYTVAVGNGWEQSEPSNEIGVFTGRLPISRRAVVAEEADAITSEGFTACWQPLEDAASYVLTVYTKEWGAPIEDGCDFADGVDALPAGWTSTSGSAYANTAYSGAAVPALRLGVTGDCIDTPEYADGVRSLSFWHRGNGTADTDRITISALAGGKWTVVAQLPIVTDKGGSTVELSADEIPASATAMRIEFLRTEAKGALAVDDITVGHGITFTNVPVEGLTDYPAGSGTTCEVAGLKAETDYYYTVSALSDDGTLRSLPSQEIAVTTGAPQSGIADITSTEADAPVEYFNLQGIRIDRPAAGQVVIRRQGTSVRKIIINQTANP
ncbi:MAG: M6 family metalloprotease domain-containing protein [Muribaculaceae bacterium]|nr:M6 family metalloprotease domain-containing protein [Muribaculaceae bacterium]